MFLHHTAGARAAGAQDTGLGLFDAFFASLSMIVVSEVRLPRAPVFTGFPSAGLYTLFKPS
jgi:hypothetical protein